LLEAAGKFEEAEKLPVAEGKEEEPKLVLAENPEV